MYTINHTKRNSTVIDGSISAYDLGRYVSPAFENLEFSDEVDALDTKDVDRRLYAHRVKGLFEKRASNLVKKLVAPIKKVLKRSYRGDVSKLDRCVSQVESNEDFDGFDNPIDNGKLGPRLKVPLFRDPPMTLHKIVSQYKRGCKWENKNLEDLSAMESVLCGRQVPNALRTQLSKAIALRRSAQSSELLKTNADLANPGPLFKKKEFIPRTHCVKDSSVKAAEPAVAAVIRTTQVPATTMASQIQLNNVPMAVSAFNYDAYMCVMESKYVDLVSDRTKATHYLFCPKCDSVYVGKGVDAGHKPVEHHFADFKTLRVSPAVVEAFAKREKDFVSLGCNIVDSKENLVRAPFATIDPSPQFVPVKPQKAETGVKQQVSTATAETVDIWVTPFQTISPSLKYVPAKPQKAKTGVKQHVSTATAETTDIVDVIPPDDCPSSFLDRPKWGFKKMVKKKDPYDELVATILLSMSYLLDMKALKVFSNKLNDMTIADLEEVLQYANKLSAVFERHCLLHKDSNRGQEDGVFSDENPNQHCFDSRNSDNTEGTVSKEDPIFVPHHCSRAVISDFIRYELSGNHTIYFDQIADMANGRWYISECKRSYTDKNGLCYCLRRPKYRKTYACNDLPQSPLRKPRIDRLLFSPESWGDDFEVRDGTLLILGMAEWVFWNSQNMKMQEMHNVQLYHDVNFDFGDVEAGIFPVEEEVKSDCSDDDQCSFKGKIVDDVTLCDIFEDRGFDMITFPNSINQCVETINTSTDQRIMSFRMTDLLKVNNKILPHQIVEVETTCPQLKAQDHCCNGHVMMVLEALFGGLDGDAQIKSIFVDEQCSAFTKWLLCCRAGMREKDLDYRIMHMIRNINESRKLRYSPALLSEILHYGLDPRLTVEQNFAIAYSKSLVTSLMNLSAVVIDDVRRGTLVVYKKLLTQQSGNF